MQKKTVLVTGGSGLIGTHILPLLRERGWRTVLLSHSARRIEGWDACYFWNPSSGFLDESCLEGVTHVLHLAGAGIADKKWSEKRKKEIIDSRVKSAALLFEKFQTNRLSPQVFVSASGIGWYGMITDNNKHREEEPAASDFMGQTCKVWEAAADRFSTLGSRVVKIRTGIVLAADGGALPVLARPVKLFAGSVIGTGNQQIAWIHIDDLCNIYLRALEEEVWHGPLNAVASEACSHREFMKILAKVCGRPLWPFSIPERLLRTIMGEMAGMVTEGCSISNRKLLGIMGNLKHTDLEEALKHILKKS